MIKSGEEILADIDSTLDQLIRNAETVRGVPVHVLQETEVEALQKTQESLLAHLLHMDALLDGEQKQALLKKKKESSALIQQKIAHFGRLNMRLINDVARKFSVKTTSLRTSRKKLKTKPD